MRLPELPGRVCAEAKSVTPTTIAAVNNPQDQRERMFRTSSGKSRRQRIEPRHHHLGSRNRRQEAVSVTANLLDPRIPPEIPFVTVVTDQSSYDGGTEVVVESAVTSSSPTIGSPTSALFCVPSTMSGRSAGSGFRSARCRA